MIDNGNLTENEAALLSHIMRWGSDGYPIMKRGSRWFWDDAHGVKGSPTPYKTKKEAFAAFGVWVQMACDKKARRI